MNHFAMSSAGERYSRGRPNVNCEVTRRIAPVTGRVKCAVDVGCGTGLSSTALLTLSDVVVGIDQSTEMLAYATRDKRIRYIAGDAEALPFRKATFGIVSVGLAFHWFDRHAFLTQAARVLDDKGWLVVYNTWFKSQAGRDSGFANWWGRYLERYPSPPRRARRPTAAELQLTGFDTVEYIEFESDIPMSLEQLIIYLTTQSNVSAVIERGEPLGSVMEWLSTTLRDVVSDDGDAFTFASFAAVYRRTG
jgi:SAM-dependent methyltransferase